METENKNQSEKWNRWAEMRHKESRLGRVLAGIIILGIGSLLLARQMGLLLPDWLFTWPMILVVVGLYVGAKRRFQGGGWLIPIIIGVFFLAEDNFDSNIRFYVWPVAFILFGLMMIFKPRRRFWGHHRQWGNWEPATKAPADNPSYQGVSEDRIDCTSVFGGVKKNIISKDFKGGDVTCFFGGAEVNLTQSDIQGSVIIDSTQVFGGAKYIIPPHWKIQSETTSVFGGIEDKRPIHSETNTDHTKILILKGTCVFGAPKSYIKK
jgi:hypothetical protein